MIDHVAFLVRSLDTSLAGLDGLSAVQPIASYAAEGTRECYLGEPSRTARILLIEPAGEGPYADALAKRGPGLHHVALNVGDLDGFMAEVVEGSGWYVHPRSLRTRRDAGTVWLARPGVEALVEVREAELEPGAPVVERITIAGAHARDGLTALFDGCGVEVKAGPRSAVVVGGRTIVAPGESAMAAPALAETGEYNRQAWNRQVRAGNRWTVGVDAAEVARARAGEVDILLTPQRFVPKAWLGELRGMDVLCLASGGGQQGPLLAAAGANVTVFDASDAQLERDREVAEREGLALRTLRGDMRNLDGLDDAAFDMIVHPCSNCFVAEIEPVWCEAYRVLRPGGHLLSGFNNPILYCFDQRSVERGDPRIRHRLPYRDVDHLDDPFVAGAIAAGHPVEFGHTLSAQIGGQLAAGFAIVGFYEDPWGSGDFPDPYFEGFIATRAQKPT